jgi:CP family cyanate transporter-like MFS transporter
MNSPTVPGAGPALPRLFVALGLLWLAAAAMRIPLLVVPPIIPLIHDDLHMTETQVGALTGMPLIMFALAAVPGSILIARFGAILVALAGLMVTAFASAARSAAPDVWMLYLATAAMGCGIAILQPALPTLVRLWTPTRVWLASAVYTNGMVVGATLGSAFTIPLVLPLVGGSWRADLLLWSAPVFAAALLYVVVALRSPSARPAKLAAPIHWWPDWKSPRLWLLGLTLGGNNALFFATNAFVPDYLTATGRPDLIALTLGWLNGAQLIASFVLLVMAETLQRKHWPFTIFGPLAVLGLIGILLGDGIWIVLAAALMGFAASVTFVVTFGLPAMLARPDDVHRMAAGMFAISYTLAVIVPIVCGAIWDITDVPWTAFIPLGMCGIGLTVSGALLTSRKS